MTLVADLVVMIGAVLVLKGAFMISPGLFWMVLGSTIIFGVFMVNRSLR